jgi:tagatose 6-phosphate kinase
MILSVTLNAALDVSYAVDRLSDCDPVRVRQVWRTPGGKGINAALVLAGLGTEVTASGLAGGATGQMIRDGLRRAGIADALYPIAGESRQTMVAVAPDGRFAEYDEPGPPVSAGEWAGFLADYEHHLPGCVFVALAGSLPPGVPADAYAILTRLAQRNRRPVLLDTSGPALRAALAVPPSIVKVNRGELAELAGCALASESDVLAAMQGIRSHGVPAVAATLGRDGLLATGDGWARRVRPPQRAGSPVGAGDALTAGLLAERHLARPVQERLRFAAALAASSVGMPAAGMADQLLARELAEQTAVEIL